jgi:hypothetical protein
MEKYFYPERNFWMSFWMPHAILLPTEETHEWNV